VVMRVSASSSNLTVQESHLDSGDPAIIDLIPLSVSDDDVDDPEHGVGPYT
jgi:hypothetical protein